MAAQNSHLGLVGHSMGDYAQMFGLTKDDEGKGILDYAAGPSSFNLEMTSLSHKVVSCDEMYDQPLDAIKQQTELDIRTMLDGVHQYKDKFKWDNIFSIDELAEIRRTTTNRFFEDFEKGVSEGRYVSQDLDKLSFTDKQFDLVLCSHFLFTDCEDQTVEYHVAHIKELCRVAIETRIFPLLDRMGEVSPLVGPVMLELQNQNYSVEIKEVPFEFQKGGNAMMRVWSETCEL